MIRKDGALATADRTEVGYELALLHIERHVVDDVFHAEPLVEVVRDDRHIRCRGARFSSRAATCARRGVA